MSSIGCCGRPEGCRIASNGCLYKPRKIAWLRAVRALARCATCGNAEQHSNHYPLALARCHDFAVPVTPVTEDQH